jgi:hypothetical protein
MFTSFSQCVSIELSIEWRNNATKFREKYELPCSPYLTITYRNNTSTPLYFFKISRSPANFPLFAGEGQINMADTLDIKKYLNAYSTNKYKVDLSGTSFYSVLWDVSACEENTQDVRESNTINDVLSDIYNFILRDTILQKKDSLIFEYNAADITENGISTKLRDNFVFLKAGEKFTDNFNLVGFQILGGDYSFMVRNDILSSFVYSNSFWDIDKEKWEFKKVLLPSKVEGYNLYSGHFYSSDVNVRFPCQQNK